MQSFSGSLASRATHRLGMGWGALLFAVIFFLGIQVALSVAMDGRHPELRDPEYGFKLIALRNRLAEAPTQPLLIVMGSSQVLNGFSPRLIANSYPEQKVPAVLFNYGLTATGPLRELLCVKRLLREGIRPRWLVIEVLPAFLALENFWTDEEGHHFTRLNRSDFRVAGACAVAPWQAYPEWLGERLVSCSAQRLCIMERIARSWCPADTPLNGLLLGMDGSGWLANSVHTLEPATYARNVARARIEYPEWLFANFHVTGQADRAMRSLLTLCAQEKIIPVLLVMPESTIFQSWYPPEAKSCLDAYLSKLRDEYAVPVIDARCWVPDDGFMDGHHLTWDGAAVFSERFNRSVVRRLLKQEASGRDDDEHIFPSILFHKMAQSTVPFQ